ncbi:hypothetical protein C8Q76DRAFT_791376 [Earliella scabrosa]|nr:hypothetical protein C8Q76DRAFT_791376 [Earliella scabrosa]
MLCVPINHVLDHPIRIPERQLRIFMDAERLELLSIKNAQIPWDGSKPTIITFCGTAGRGRVRIVLKTGKCQRDVRRLDAASPHTADMWANIYACLDRVEAADGAQHGYEVELRRTSCLTVVTSQARPAAARPYPKPPDEAHPDVDLENPPELFSKLSPRRPRDMLTPIPANPNDFDCVPSAFDREPLDERLPSGAESTRDY